MTGPLLLFLGGASFGVFFLWYTRVKVDAWWYGTLTGDLYTYLCPPFGMMTAIVGAFQLLEAAGIEPSKILFGVPLVLVLVWNTVSLATILFGLPKIPFLLPRWIRERRREEKRLRQ